MVRAPFQLTPLTLDTLAVLVKAVKPLSAREVAAHIPHRKYEYIVKALSRIHTTGWATCQSTPRPTGPAVMGYALKAAHRAQAAAIMEDQKRPKRKSPTHQAPPLPQPLGAIIWRHPRVLIAEAILKSDVPLSPSQIATQTQFVPALVRKALLRMEVEGVVKADRPYDPKTLVPERTFTITTDAHGLVTERVERWHRENPHWKPGTARNRQLGSLDKHTDYLSTACRHEEHKHCRSTTTGDGASKEPGTCKFCDAKCICYCHPWNY